MLVVGKKYLPKAIKPISKVSSKNIKEKKKDVEYISIEMLEMLVNFRSII